MCAASGRVYTALVLHVFPRNCVAYTAVYLSCTDHTSVMPPTPPPPTLPPTKLSSQPVMQVLGLEMSYIQRYNFCVDNSAGNMHTISSFVLSVNDFTLQILSLKSLTLQILLCNHFKLQILSLSQVRSHSQILSLSHFTLQIFSLTLHWDIITQLLCTQGHITQSLHTDPITQSPAFQTLDIITQSLLALDLVTPSFHTNYRSTHFVTSDSRSNHPVTSSSRSNHCHFQLIHSGEQFVQTPHWLRHPPTCASCNQDTYKWSQYQWWSFFF